MRERCLQRLGPAVPALGLAAVAFASVSCGQGEGDALVSSRDASPPLAAPIDPLSCASCHPGVYQAWSLSMHAYASDDPIFVAMNARGQRETGGALGDFCVRCHAPVALARGATFDGRNLTEIPSALRGVTCVACHSDPGNAAGAGPLTLATDGIMRGPIADAMPNPVHRSVYSASLDRDQPAAASLCGVCHAVTNSHGLEVERTFDEWRATTYAQPASLRTCARCHMPESIGVAAVIDGAPQRRVHDHAMPGVDLGVASPLQRQLVQEELDPAISSKLCVIPEPGAGGTQVSVTLENARIGHAWPSGATHDRRAWLEIVGYTGSAVAYASGAVANDEAVTMSASRPLILLGEQLQDAAGRPTLFMWGAQTARSQLLATAAADPSHATLTATVRVPAGVDRVTSRVRVRPVDYDVADALAASGDLSAPAAAGMPTLPTLTVAATALEWTSDRGPSCLP
jgi:hypothetical protein